MGEASPCGGGTPGLTGMKVPCDSQILLPGICTVEARLDFQVILSQVSGVSPRQRELSSDEK